MDRVLSIQASRRFGHDSETFITKRMCFSFLFSIGFLTLLGGFLLGRYSLDRELEIKKKHLDFERHAHRTRHGSYSDALEQFSEALQNLTTAVGDTSDAGRGDRPRLDANETAALWRILRCRDEIAVDAYRPHGADVKVGVESILSGRLNSLTDCLKRGLAYVLSRK